MLATQTEEPRIQITRYALRDICAWLGVEMPRYARERLINFGMKIVLALAIAAVLYVGIFFLALFGGGDNLRVLPLYLLLLVPLVPFFIAVPVQAVLQNRAFGVMQVNGQRVRFADEHTDFRSDDENSGWPSLRLLLLPVWLFFSAFESLLNAWRLSRADPELCAEIMAGMAAIDRRVPIAEIEDQYRDENLVQTVRGLLAFPGVMVSSREYPCLLLSHELGDTIRAML